jgi:hypothetical protein
MAWMHPKSLLIATALGEGGIALLLLIWPPVPQWLLLGKSEMSSEALFFARIAGAALLAFGISCWAGRNQHNHRTQQGLLVGALIYDVAAALILADAGWFLKLAGIVLWPAVILHGALAIWCVACMAPAPRASKH